MAAKPEREGSACVVTAIILIIVLVGVGAIFWLVVAPLVGLR